MAHSAIHFSLGIVVGTAVALPPLATAWRKGEPLASHFLRWFLLSYGLGLFALVPAFLKAWGCSAGICQGWWMNLFLFHPLLGRLKSGGNAIGPAIIFCCCAFQYLLLLAAIRSRARSAKICRPSSV